MYVQIIYSIITPNFSFINVNINVNTLKLSYEFVTYIFEIILIFS